MRILVIEDDKDSALALATLLGVWGHEVRVQDGGRGALAEVAAWRPDAMLLDLGLEGLDGCQVARRVRALPGGDACFIIVLTGYGQAEDRQHAMASGCDEFLLKPADLDELRALLDREQETAPKARLGSA